MTQTWELLAYWLMYYYLGNFDKAIATHRHATELSPSVPIRWSNLGAALSGPDQSSGRGFIRVCVDGTSLDIGDDFFYIVDVESVGILDPRATIINPPY